MAITRPSAVQIGAVGERIYDQKIRADIQAGDIGRYISIDTRSGDYEIGEDHLQTVDLLYAKHPDALPYTKKIGYTAAVKIGGRLKREDEVSQ